MTPKSTLTALLLGAGAALVLSGAASAQVTSLTGMWIVDAKDFGRERGLPLTPAGQKIIDDQKKAVEAGDVIGSKVCGPTGMRTLPAMMA